MIPYLQRSKNKNDKNDKKSCMISPLNQFPQVDKEHLGKPDS
jgi:hypothetical protein